MRRRFEGEARSVSVQTRVMGILNVTPDSFSDGGQTVTVEAALSRARAIEAAGADWIDIGGESTGPDSKDVSAEEELRRVIPVVEAVAQSVRVPISVDTTKAAVAREALVAGATMINDVSALRWDPEMARVVATSGAFVILMYAKDDSPRTTRHDSRYEDVVGTVCHFLAERIEWARANGIADERILVDPGLGWFLGADPRYSFEVLAGLGRVRALGYPLVVGPSRKSFLGSVRSGDPRPATDRLMATAGAVAISAWNGATLVRVHDVAEMVQVVATVEAIRQASDVGRSVESVS